ncbi:MAG TPA: GAF domain-containing protein, partial [Nitrospiria bacterium]|nr:GAF domain-containing protein [Nitrospiria bacterium]
MKPNDRYSLFGIPLYLLAYLWLKHNGSWAAEVLFLFSPCLAALSAWGAGRRLHGNERLFWYRLSLGALLWGAFKSISIFSQEGFPLGDAAACLGYSLFYLWALWALYTDPGRYKRIKKWLDFLLLTGTALLLVWPIGAKGIHPQLGFHRLVLPIGLTGDLLLLLSSLLVYIDKGARRKGWMLLLSGILLVGYGNLLQGFTLLTSPASSSPVAQLGWTAGFLMIVGAAWFQIKRGESPAKSPAMTLQFYIPSAAMLLVPLVLAYSIFRGKDNHVLFIFSVPLILLAICRHLVTERDLEVRVREQERDNHRLSFLNVMADALGGALDVHGIFDRVFEKTSEQLPIDGGGILLIDHRSHDLDLVFSRGVSRDFVRALQSERLRLGEGITGTVAVTGQPYATASVLEDRTVSRHRLGLLSSEGISGFAAIPLVAWERIIGVLVLFSRREYLFKPEEINLLASVGKQVAVAIESRRMDQEQARRSREALAFFHLAQAMTSTLELHEVLEVILDHLEEIFGMQSAWVMLYDPDKEHLEMAALRGWREGDLDLKGVVLRPGEGVSGEVFKRRVPIFVADVAEDPRFIYKEAAARSGIRSMIGVPLIVKGKAIGMIGLYVPALSEKNEIERDRMDLLLTFASQAAIAIENARLYRDLAAKVEQLKSLQGQLIQTEKLSAIGEL